MITAELGFLLGGGSRRQPKSHIGKYPIADGVLMTKSAEASSLWIQAPGTTAISWICAGHVKERKGITHKADFNKAHMKIK